MGSPTPSQEELRDLSLACQRVWSLDENRLEPGRDYQVDLQVLEALHSSGPTTLPLL